MLKEDNNLKDSSKVNLGLSVTDISFSISYTKTHKLITALYMVTDIIDKEEPIRYKLRSLGAEIISDMHSIPINACKKIAETVSFLNIASAMNFISEMNCSILKKELLDLKTAIEEYGGSRPTWLTDFFSKPHPNLEESAPEKPALFSEKKFIGHDTNKRHQVSNSIGVQKGSTLLKALSEKTHLLSKNVTPSNLENFDVLKNKRRDEILKIIKAIGSGVTIKDIKDKVKETPQQYNSLTSCGEKTLQRELVSMVRDGVLNKTGEKRWSKYFIK